ncbi:MAG: hypothetical protein EA376_02355 [Phycisphaeraceae bacterium]|nr:MAG: hypothetical protein EA376_02355 [Phycisphaeraceae bacterium]
MEIGAALRTSSAVGVDADSAQVVPAATTMGILAEESAAEAERKEGGAGEKEYEQRKDACE